MSKVGTGLEEIKVKSDVDVAIPTVAHSAFPSLQLVESDVKERASVLLDVEFLHLPQNFKSIVQNTATMTQSILKGLKGHKVAQVTCSRHIGRERPRFRHSAFQAISFIII